MANALKERWTAEETINRMYDHLYDTGEVGFLQQLVDSIELQENANFWTEHFVIEGSEYDIDLADTKKNPAWTVQQREVRVVPMADPMAPLSETRQLETEGFHEETGAIFGYGKGLFETSMSKIGLQNRLAQMSPEDRSLVTALQRGVKDLIKSHNLRLSNMAAMTLSYGGAYNTTTVQDITSDGSASTKTSQGASGVVVSQRPYIPLENFKKAGSKVWTDPSCDIPEQMKKIEHDFKEKKSLDESTPFEWDIPYDMVVNVLLKNAAFIKEVNRYIRLEAPDKVVVINNSNSSINADTITWKQLVAYSTSDISKIAPIRVVHEQQTVHGITSYYTVRGWKKGTAVLRPLGMAGVVVHAIPEWAKLMQSGEINDNIQWSMAKWNNLLYIINKITPNGITKSYHTDALGRYATVLNESQYHVCVDTTTADS
jgi:hypothetical protein